MSLGPLSSVCTLPALMKSIVCETYTLDSLHVLTPLLGMGYSNALAGRRMSGSLFRCSVSRVGRSIVEGITTCRHACASSQRRLVVTSLDLDAGLVFGAEVKAVAGTSPEAVT